MDKRGLEWSPDAVSAESMAILAEEMLVLLHTYKDRITAMSDRSVLKSAGIETLFFSENLANLGSQRIGIPLLELKLMVRAKDFEAAKHFLEREAVLESIEEVEPATVEIAGKPVVLRTYRDMPAAFVDKSVLDAAGIRCYLQDANVVRMDWLWSNAMGGIKLVVSEGDAEDAAKILDTEPLEQADEAEG
jgi:hypothetical protein